MLVWLRSPRTIGIVPRSISTRKHRRDPSGYLKPKHARRAAQIPCRLHGRAPVFTSAWAGYSARGTRQCGNVDRLPRQRQIVLEMAQKFWSDDLAFQWPRRLQVLQPDAFEIIARRQPLDP